MARFKQFKTAFNSGQVDPNVFGRTDTAQYATAAAEMLNCVCMPQGGADKRKGFRYIDTIAEGTIEARSIPFIFGAPTGIDQTYIVVVAPTELRVYDAVNEDLEAVIETPYTEDQLYEIDYAQSYDVMILTHPSHAPQELIRNGESDWVFRPIVFDNIPQFSFVIPVDASTVMNRQNISFSTSFVNGSQFSLTMNGQTQAFTYNVVTTTNQNVTTEDATAMAAEVQGFLRAAAGGDGIDVTVRTRRTEGANIGTELEPIYEVTITLSFLSVTFSGDQLDAGLAITTTTSGIVITSTTTTPPPEVATPEDVWSETRGWPSTVTFFENRLWFGGSLSRPTTIWASRTGLFFDFSVETPDGDTVDDDYIDVTLDTDQVNRINALHADRNLLIFTTAAEFYVNSTPATPATISIVSTSRVGSARAKPVNYDNVTMFITRNGNSIRDFVFDFNSDGYISNSITKLSSGIIKDPRQIVVQRNNESSETDYLYIRNSDGTIAVFSGDRLNGVSAWSIFDSSGGTCQSLTVVNDRVFGVFVRQQGGFSTTTIEIVCTDGYLDSFVTRALPEDLTITDLNHLANQQVDILRGDIYLGRKSVTTTGRLIVDNGNEGDVLTIGIPYSLRVKTLPLQGEGNQGNIKWDRKRILRALIEVLETSNLEIDYNGRRRRMKGRTSIVTLGSSPPLLTGFQEIFLSGYSRTTQVALVQELPYPCTVLSLGLEVEI